MVEDCFVRLGQADVCLCCGKSKEEVELHPDHFIPQIVENRPRRKDNPLRRVVRLPHNTFALCEADHHQIDHIKISAFQGKKRARDINPASLIEVLKNYPITPDERYRQTQIESMITVIKKFILTVRDLEVGHGLPKRMIPKYQKAAFIAEEFVESLYELREDNE